MHIYIKGLWSLEWYEHKFYFGTIFNTEVRIDEEVLLQAFDNDPKSSMIVFQTSIIEIIHMIWHFSLSFNT